MKSLIVRAQRLEVLPPSRITSLFKQYSARRYNNNEPYPLAPESPTVLRTAVKLHIEDHEYSVAELAEIARMAVDELEAQSFADSLPHRQTNVLRLFAPS
jgi:hypothetical protein